MSVARPTPRTWAKQSPPQFDTSGDPDRTIVARSTERRSRPRITAWAHFARRCTSALPRRADRRLSNRPGVNSTQVCSAASGSYQVQKLRVFCCGRACASGAPLCNTVNIDVGRRIAAPGTVAYDDCIGDKCTDAVKRSVSQRYCALDAAADGYTLSTAFADEMSGLRST